ncbi:carbohydrate kinase family protein [Streptomyces sp. H34-S4]|uniref:carbohydrate kinase family protein n=1 Tax=Streptomyces sp. H34-S4 TaxID=2996463 RepID=UPI00226E224A|nr:carbohydrate kinase family protein [Streptomyces sp. H34-S4]MCY0935182.1 carbohydrate kinase family protein [Streptomyces sp. H34-S4]
MDIAVTGSIATDHLATFPGRFAEQIIPESLATISLSFLVDDLQVRRGGVAANICFGLGRLGLAPVLVGAAGTDFAEYDALLRACGVDTGSVKLSTTRHTARFMCTTDVDHNQIASFYPGAMVEAQEIDLADVVDRVGALDLVVVAPDVPEAMVRHTKAAHAAGIPVAADPSQQLARLDEESTRLLVDGARFLFTNAYESALLRQRTGWSEAEVLARVGVWIVTRGADGVSILTADGPAEHVPAVATPRPVDPTGVGDAFRSGFLAGLSRGLPHRRAAELGCAVATIVLESSGTQEYKLLPWDLSERLLRAYGAEAAAEIGVWPGGPA